MIDLTTMVAGLLSDPLRVDWSRAEVERRAEELAAAVGGAHRLGRLGWGAVGHDRARS